MKLKKNQPLRIRKRLKNKARLRKKISGTVERPRLSVFRSQHHIYAQIIDDEKGETLGMCSTLKLDKGGSCKAAQEVGKSIAALAKKQKIGKVVFDRGGFIYHGRIKALAEGAREAGLKF
ncbi:MAG: 50S ribosomal protein L18 [Bdellovibrionales bacterium]|nr:50S ribosomal protein L18 [Bdellovibrionales bacterium]